MTYDEALRQDAERRLRQFAEARAFRRAIPPAVLTTGDDYAHQGHRLDLADERLIPHDEPRFLPERRVWRDGMWQIEPARARRCSKPAKRPAPRRIEARGQDPDIVLHRAVTAVVRQDHGRPEEVTVVVGRSLYVRWRPFRFVVVFRGQEVAYFDRAIDAHNAKSKMAWPRRLLTIERR